MSLKYFFIYKINSHSATDNNLSSFFCFKFLLSFAQPKFYFINNFFLLYLNFNIIFYELICTMQIFFNKKIFNINFYLN
jgi:hypothetical protein